MLYAVSAGARITAGPGHTGHCPTCGQPVRTRQSGDVGWTWGHVAGDCDPWAEPLTAWHLSWLHEFPAEQREQVAGPHRADIITGAGWTVELQQRAISVDEIRSRERHYGDRMVWLFDATGDDGRRLDVPAGADLGDDTTFRWPGGRRSLTACGRPTFLDVGGGFLLRVLEAKAGSPLRGTVRVGSRDSFLRWARREPVAS